MTHYIEIYECFDDPTESKLTLVVTQKGDNISFEVRVLCVNSML